MKIYATWDCWTCQCKYYKTFKKALKHASKYLNNHYHDKAEDMIAQLIKNGEAVDYNGMIIYAIDEFKVK